MTQPPLILKASKTNSDRKQKVSQQIEYAHFTKPAYNKFSEYCSKLTSQREGDFKDKNYILFRKALKQYSGKLRIKLIKTKMARNL